jgi:sterol desaturase/sphingolipid hydroxylase (fatty acid hydroxylase superfamily)
MNSYEKYLTILILSIFVFELVLATREKIRQALVTDMLVNLGIGLTTITIGLFMKGVSYGFFLLVYHFAFFKPGPSPVLWIIGLLGCDFVIYWYHYLGHKTRLFWAAHVTHHSSVHFNISVGFRVSFIHVFYRFLFWSPLCLLGIPPYMILFFDSITTIDNILIHTGRIKKLGILDLVFNTPSNHRVHHAVNPQYLDKNMGGILIIFDHLFGTYAPEKETPVYGITKNINSHNPATILLHEYRDILRQLPQIPGWKEKIKYLFSPPV